jgi:hypothetical protein
MSGASNTTACSGQGQSTAVEVPSWVKEWQQRYDSGSGEQHPTADTTLSGFHAGWTLVQELKDKVSTKIERSHLGDKKTTAEPLDKKRKEDMRQKTFCSTLHTLHNAQMRLLHEAFADNYSPEIAATVRKLADSLQWKIQANRPQHMSEGKRLLCDLMTQYQEEFEWKKIVEILETATTRAREEANKEYNKSKRTVETLKRLRHE